MSANHHRFWEQPEIERLLASPATPCFVVGEELLARNLAVLERVQARTGARILLALKGFAMWSVFPLLKTVLKGTCASSPHEAMLGREEFGGETHVFAAGYSREDMEAILPVADHVVFNSFAQYRSFGPLVRETNRTSGRAIQCGIRVNPEHSEGAVPIYDPCSPGSRLGVRLAAFEREARAGGLEGISGLHFHTLCEQDAAALDRTLAAVEEKFGPWLPRMDWLNFGGGHHITRDGYDVDLLCRCIERARERYKVRVYLEPGEAVALNTGVLVSTVLDVCEADMPVAVLDTSAAAHMPDVLEMPYRPEVLGSAMPREKSWTCRLAGKSCLAGDVIGEYSFDVPLKPGDRLVFLDMAHYSMVKTTTFNGLGLPSIARITRDNVLVLQKSFSYRDFKNRLS